MSDTREKLIELLIECRGADPAYYGIEAQHIADHLISHGVTFNRDCHWATEQAYKNGKADALKWIPVSERLPEKKKEIDGEFYYRNVAVRVKNLLHERIAYYDPEHECWYDTGFFQIRGVTHWAELPEWED